MSAPGGYGGLSIGPRPDGPGLPVAPGGPAGPGSPGGPGGAGLPEPPPGPGVTPPFTAPPTDRNRRGLWIGLGVGALVVILCCVGGVFGFGLLAVNTSKQLEANATEVVRGYLDALEGRDYDKAYSYLCPTLTKRLSANEFAEQQQVRPRPVDYRLGKPEIGSTVVVPANVSYSDGTAALRQYTLTQEAGSTDLHICGST
jgi:hypothetical protein